jgi:hypothetical protein
MTARSWALALVLAASAPIWAATSQQHVAAARAAEKRSEWRKALREWQAAYRMEINAEYLIRIGDAYAHLGKKREARKQYEAYLANPLALPDSAAHVKGKIAALDARAGAAMALDLPARVDAKTKQAALPPIALPAPLPLPELDLPAAKPAAPAKKTDLALALPDLPGIAPTEAPKNQPPPLAQSPSAKPAQTLAAAAPSSATTPAVARPPPSATEPRKAPAEAILAEAPRPGPASAGGARRTVAWVAAGVAVVALGGGALAYTKASSAQSDLTGSVHDGPSAKSLLDSEKQYKTLSFIGLAGGLVAAGVSAALFAF